MTRRRPPGTVVIDLDTGPDRTIFASCRPHTVRALAGVCYPECDVEGEAGTHTGRVVIDVDVDSATIDDPGTAAISVTPALARHLARCLLQAALDVETAQEWEFLSQRRRLR